MNHISSCKSVRKINAPKLESFDLSTHITNQESHYFNDYEHIEELNGPKISKIHATSLVKTNDLSNLTWVFKL